MREEKYMKLKIIKEYFTDPEQLEELGSFSDFDLMNYHSPKGETMDKNAVLFNVMIDN